MYDVITIGSATVDVHAVTDHHLIKVKTSHHVENMIAFPSGCKVLIDELLYTIGGGGTNTAVSFSRLGLKTGYIGCLGQDSEGKQVKDILKKENITFLGHTSDKKTGYSIILDSKDKDRAILAFKGANNYLDASQCKPFQTKWIYLSSMVGDSFENQCTLVANAGAKVAFNPSEYQAKMGIDALSPLLRLTDVLILNAQEIALLTDNPDIYASFAMLHSVGIKMIICTNGSKRILASDSGYFYSVMPPDVKVVETTGAGDAFASAFVALLSKTNDMKTALLYGLFNSVSVLSHFGAKEKLLTVEEIEQRSKRYTIEVKRFEKRAKLVA